MIEFLLGAECLRRGFVTHLDKIADGEIGKGVGVFFSSHKIFGKGALAALPEFFQAFIEHDAILEGSVHSLAVKRDDRVRGVADERNLVSVKPRRATNRYE